MKTNISIFSIFVLVFVLFACSNGSTDTPGEVIIYKIGDIGPGGGIIFYDKGDDTDDWRYLEAAPNDISGTISWSGSSSPSITTEEGIGKGKSNTLNIVNEHNSVDTAADNAAIACNEYKNLSKPDIDGWFLPSIEELKFMYSNLHKKGLGNFQNDPNSSCKCNKNLIRCFEA